jgi:acetyl esterase/lipase
MTSATKFFLIIGLLFLLILLFGIFSTTFQLWVVNRIAALQGFQLQPSIAYGSLREQRLDIYQPQEHKSQQEKNKQPLPVVIFFYGGCWGACITGTKENYAFVVEAFSSNNMIAVVPDYRLYPSVNFPDIISDASAAVEWVHNNIGRYGGDPKKIFLMGHSSGAHMAAMLAVNPAHLSQATYADIKGLIGVAGPYHFLPFSEDYMPILFGLPMQLLDSQPIQFVDGSEPPALLLYGAADSRVKPVNINTMTEKILGAGGKVDKHIYKGLDHASVLSAYSVLFRDKNSVFSDTLNFIKTCSVE